MEENKNEVKYSVVVPYNNPYMVAARKKTKVFSGVIILVCGLIFAVITILAATANNSSVGAAVFFGVFTAFAILCGIYYLCSTKPNSKNDNKSITYNFNDDYLDVYEDDANKNKHKNLTRCLYRSYSNKQYVDSIIEDNSKFEIKVYTGTYNMVPQYKKYIVPKEIIKNEELESFKTFLQERLGKDYFVKQK